MSAFNRRSFLSKSGKFSLATLCAALSEPVWSRNLQKALAQHQDVPAGVLSGDEDFWYYVQQSFTVTAAVINLNNGGVAPAPKVVQEAVKRYLDFSNEAPSFHMLRILDLGREQLRRDLATLAGVDAGTIALQRNATEALETIIFGLPLKAGDEVVLSKQDYPSMINAWKQRAQRDGLKLVWTSLQLPSEDPQYLTEAYTRHFTAKTKVVHVTHMINWNGQILPVRQIADAAHARGIQVVVDGAQSFAHIPFNIPDLGADYFAASLHKWLSACIGTGMLYVKEEHIKNLVPLFASPKPDDADIRKFEHLGTRPIFIEQATGKAIDFHRMIGADRKAARLHYLKNYWMERVQHFPRVHIGTSLKPGFGCAIGIVSIEGISPVDLDNFFFQKFRIHTTPIDQENIKGVRITPNVYTTTKDLDTLARAVEQASKKGMS